MQGLQLLKNPPHPATKTQIKKFAHLHIQDSQLLASGFIFPLDFTDMQTSSRYRETPNTQAETDSPMRLKHVAIPRESLVLHLLKGEKCCSRGCVVTAKRQNDCVARFSTDYSYRNRLTGRIVKCSAPRN